MGKGAKPLSRKNNWNTLIICASKNCVLIPSKFKEIQFNSLRLVYMKKKNLRLTGQEHYTH